MGGVRVGKDRFELNIVYEDDQSDSKLSARLAERLINEDRIKYLLGPYSSGLTMAVARVAEEFEVPQVAAEGASKSLFTRGFKYLFGLFSTSDQYMDGVIELAIRNAESEGETASQLKLAIAVQNDRFSQFVRRAVKNDAQNAGIRVVVDETLPDGLEEMAGFFARVRETKPDIIIVSGHAKGAEIATRHIRDLRIRAPVIAMTHCEAADIARKFGSAADGIYCPAQWAPSLSYRGEIFGTPRDFEEAFKAEYPGEYPGEVPYQSASAAAAVIVWKDALERANSLDPKDLRDALTATDLQTFYGRIRFAQTGEIISKPMIVRQIQDRKYVPVWPPDLVSQR